MATTSLKRVLIMAGGTGGHVFPGLAVANHLRERGIEVHWLGTSTGLEARLIPDANIPLHTIRINGLRGKGFKSLLAAPITISKAVFQSLQIIKAVNPDVIIGMGGFVSGPGGLASWLARRPLIIHEQNAKAGLTNKLLARFAKRILEGFPAAFKPQVNARLIGNPVRQDIAALSPPRIRFSERQSPLRLLVIGGSLGAKALNAVVPEAIAKLDKLERPQVLHQTGDKHFAEAQKIYAACGLEDHAQFELKPFISNMAEAYDWADVVLCRAGALTVAELCAVGLPAIFVPFPYAVDDHQTANANFMVKNQAALCIQQADLTAEGLANIIREFSHLPEKRLKMAEAAYQLRNVQVTEKIFDILCEVVKNPAPLRQGL